MPFVRYLLKLHFFLWVDMLWTSTYIHKTPSRIMMPFECMADTKNKRTIIFTHPKNLLNLCGRPSPPAPSLNLYLHFWTYLNLLYLLTLCWHVLKSQHVPPSGYLQFKLEMSVEPTTKSFLMMLRIHAFKKGGKKTRLGNHIFKNEEEKNCSFISNCQTSTVSWF